MILQRFGNSDVHTTEIDGNKIETANSVDLLGIHIDNKLTFDDHNSPCATKPPCN